MPAAPRVVAPDTLRRILAALGLPADTRGDLAASRRVLAKRATLTDLPPLVTATAGRPTRLDLGAAEPRPAKLMLEHGGSRDLTLMPARGRLRIPAVAETGYHRLEVGDREVVLAVAPPQCRTIDDMVPDARLWGVAAQVYALRSAGDGGIGDAAGIAELAEALAARGADALCLSPMHALFTADPGHFGPYSPSSRLFLNPLHAAPALVFGAEQIAQAMRESGLGESIRPVGGGKTDRLAGIVGRQARPAARAVRQLPRRAGRRGRAARRLRQFPRRRGRSAAPARHLRSAARRPGARV